MGATDGPWESVGTKLAAGGRGLLENEPTGDPL
jgi:hypothetical protein